MVLFLSKEMAGPMTVLMLCMKQFMSKAQNEAPAWFAGLPGK